MRNKLILMSALSLALISGCTSDKEPVTVGGITKAFADAKLPIGDIESFNKDTDPNKQLGKPGYYTEKADFADNRLEQVDNEYSDEKDLTGGKIEIFESEEDAQKRFNYLEKMNDPELGPLALDEYVYLQDNVLLRITYDLSEKQAKEYNETLENYLK
ncbi:hypothetical protein ACQKL5_09225 [Peribacillus sp. NPDC097675]|uniref:hypothetical protein n=1 Tax=Peribacillus sp. NPDC097675 TaxID=3390618 RepID=UPI003D0124E5